MPRPLTWAQCHALGARLSKELDHCHTLQEVADELGISKQSAYHETAVALGKYILLLRRRLSIVPEVR